MQGGWFSEAWRHVVRAAGLSMDGIRQAARDELAFRIELVVLVLAVPAALWLARSWWEAGVLLALVVLTLAAELVNTAIEAACDRITTHPDPLVKKAKDCGSAAVMLAAIATALVWAAALLARLQ